MELIPEEELKRGQGFNFAPMIDFLFLMLALFATLALSRASLFDTNIELAELSPEKEKVSIQAKEDLQSVNLSIASDGSYKWLTEFEQYPMENTKALQKELMRQLEIGALPQEKAKTNILLHIDQKAPWKAIADAIFSVRELGFDAHPLYEPSDQSIVNKK